MFHLHFPLRPSTSFQTLEQGSGKLRREFIMRVVSDRRIAHDETAQEKTDQAADGHLGLMGKIIPRNEEKLSGEIFGR